jgi:hypothetical protein
MYYSMQPTNSTYMNVFGSAYWQWANAYTTMAIPNVQAPSIGYIAPAMIAGYYEISYFHDAYFNAHANPQNVATFQNTQLYNNDFLTGVNYEHLFLTYDIFSQNTTTNPPLNSLFSLQNIQQLITLGQSTPNILIDTELVYGVDFFLNDDWFALTTTLGLDFVDQTYLIWLWLDTGKNMTYSRMQNGGNE